MGVGGWIVGDLYFVDPVYLLELLAAAATKTSSLLDSFVFSMFILLLELVSCSREVDNPSSELISISYDIQ